MKKEYSTKLIDFIDKSPSQFHVVENAEKILIKNGFQKLNQSSKWNLEKCGKYFVTNNSSSFIAFEIGEGDIAKEGFRLIGSHTDSPTFRVKPNPEINVEKSYLKLNIEMYGGAIISSWMDRVLSLAGRVCIKTDNLLKPKELLVNIDKDLLTIPNLCIHMNRNANENISFNKQKDILPIISLIKNNFEKEGFLIDLISKELNIDVDDILDFELYLYNREKGKIIGLNQEFISIGKLDDLAMLHASILSLIESKENKCTKIIVANDNEEIGSLTKQGANSPMLKDTLKRIMLSLGYEKEDFYRAIENSFIISADMAHALHPNYTDKSDPTNKPIINKGPVIKIDGNGAYTSDAISIGIYKGICEKAGIPYQTFVNRSDMRGGSTIGPLVSQKLNIKSIDVGNAVLGMHSVRELAGVDDYYFIIQSFKEYFNYNENN